MTTRKEDAASIIGEELAEELEGKEKALVGRSDLVIKSEDEETPAVEKMEDGYYRPFGGATTIADARAYIEANKEQQRIGDLMYAFQCVMSNIACDDELEDKGAAIASAAKEFEGMLKDKNVQIFDSLAQLSLLSDPVPAPPNPVLTKLDEIANRLTALSEAAPAPEPPAHPLDESIEQLRSDYDQIMLMEAPAQEKLQQIQGAYSALGARLQQLLAQTPAPTPATAPDSNALLLEVLQKMSDKLDLLTSQRSMPAPAPTAIPRPRSIPASAVPQQPASAPRTGPRSLRSMIEQSVGLESGS